MKYYICPSCGKLTNDYEIEKESEYGGNPYCDCEYMEMQWDPNHKDFQPVYFRSFVGWIRIPMIVFIPLSNEHNEVIRLKMLRSIPDFVLQSLILEEDRR